MRTTPPIWIPGLPVSQPRVAACLRGSHAGVYTPAKADAWKAAVALAVAREMAEPWGGPLHVGVTFQMPRPKGHYGSGRNSDKVKPGAPIAPTGRPDLDNLVKAVLDALRGIAWGDDTQVVSLHARKVWADPSPGAVILIREVVP